MILLPKTPSILIRIALKALEKAEADHQLAVDMCVYIDGDYMPHLVGFAGAVMFFRLGADSIYRTKHLLPTDFPENRNQLRALTCFSKGLLSQAFVHLGLHGQDAAIQECKQDITPYETSPEKFKEDMTMLANELGKHRH